MHFAFPFFHVMWTITCQPLISTKKRTRTLSANHTANPSKSVLMKNDRLKRNIPLDTQGPLGGLKKKKCLDNRFSPRARRESFRVSFTTSHLPVGNQSKHLSMKKKERKINSTCCERGSRDPVRFYGLKAPSVSAFETRYIYIYISSLYNSVIIRVL